MSLRLDGVGDYAQRIGAANLGNTADGTALLWYRKEDSTADREILNLARSGQAGLWQIASSTQVKAHINTEAGVSINMATNSWAGLAVVHNATDANWYFYFYQSGTLTLVATQGGGSGGNLATLRIGNNDGWGDSALGSNRYLRFWNRALSAAEIQAEFEMTPSGGTPAASTTGLFDSWLLPDDTSGTGVHAGTALTISGAVTSTEEPMSGGGGASVFIPTQYRRTNSLLRM